MRRHAPVCPLVCVLGVACGHGDGLAPSTPVAATPTPAPVAAASPTPAPTPTPAVPAAPSEDPDAEPSPDCIHDSDHGVDSVSLAVYFLECSGQRIPGSKDMRDIPLGCRIHFNATPRDGMGAPTCSRTWPVWQVGPEEIVRGGGLQTFTPAYATLGTGQMAARCIVDGVRSDWIFLNIVDP